MSDASQNYANLRYSDLDEIKTDNVANLKAAWTMSTGATRGLCREMFGVPRGASRRRRRSGAYGADAQHLG